MVKYKFETFARLRPPVKSPFLYRVEGERLLKVQSNFRKGAENRVVNNNKDSFDFAFTSVFDIQTSQEVVFERVAK